MNFQQAAPLIDFSSALAGKQAQAPARPFPGIRATHAEVSQQLRNRLQATLELEEILNIFLAASQRLIAVQGLQFAHKAQQINLSVGQFAQPASFHVEYQLELQGEVLGELSFFHQHRPDENELVSLESLCAALVFPLRNALKYYAALHAAQHDPLTGVRNRASLQSILDRDMQSAHRMQQPLSVIMFDVDHFKKMNDTYGHVAGDKVLVEVAKMIEGRLRSMDAVFRYGGEEFCISLPNTDAHQAQLVSERLRQAVENLTVNFEGHFIRLTASLGVAVLQPGEQQQNFLQRADQALYEAKNSGRNQVCLAH